MTNQAGKDPTTAEHLTEEEKKDERIRSEKVLAFLDAKRSALKLSEKQALYKQMAKTIDEGFQKLFKKLAGMSELKFKAAADIVTLKWEYSDSSEAFTEFQNYSIRWAYASWEHKTVKFSNLLAFAPKEIIRALATHETLHIIYRMLEPSCLNVQPITVFANEYPEDQQQEEHWVRTMNKRLGFMEENMMLWQIAVEIGGEMWRPRYYEIKKNPVLRSIVKQNCFS